MKNIKLKLQDKKSFTYMAYKVIQSKLFSAGLMFASSIIIIRYLPKDDYGLYVLMMAFFAVFELFMGGFDASLVRFIPTSGKIQQHKLIATILYTKTFITIAILFSIYFLYNYSYQWLNIPLDKLNIYSKLYMIVGISFIFRYIASTTSTLLTSFMKYDILFKVSIISGILSITNSIFIWQFSYGIVEYVLVSTVISFILALINFYYLYGSKHLSFQKIKFYLNFTDAKQILKSQVLPYSAPLLGVSLLSYVKNYLPTYLFGTMASLETLAVYSVFKKITNFLHKGYAGFIQGLYPKLFQMMHSKSKAIDKLFWIGLILRVIAFIMLYLGYDMILSLYDIKESNLNSFIFIVLISTFFVSYFVTFGTLVIMSNKSTKDIFLSSLTMNIISIVLIPVFYHFFDIFGIVMGEMLSKYIGFHLVILKSQMLKLKLRMVIYYITIFSSLIIILMSERSIYAN